MSSKDRSLDKSEWTSFFANLSKEIEGSDAAIEVAGLDLGDQMMGTEIALEGFSYDPKNDDFWVHTVPIEHRIAHPREIYVTEDDGKLQAVGVRDGEGRLQIVRLSSPLERKTPPRGDRPSREAEAPPPGLA
jgi:hypothetical protein